MSNKSDPLEQACLLVGRFLYHFARVEQKIDQAVIKLLDLDQKTAPIVALIDLIRKVDGLVRPSADKELKKKKERDFASDVCSKVRNWHGSAHLNELGCAFGMRPPGRGDFWILKIAHAPSPKNLSKNGLPQKGGSLSVESVFAKKFSGAGEDSAVGACVRLQSRACGRGV
jgi:hypothetical protein